MIAIIDYDAGNIRSVEKAVKKLGFDPLTTRDSDEIKRASHVILPGVGAFGDAMDKLHRFGLVQVIKESADCGKPFLGICLGGQLIFEKSEESPGVQGLALLKGEVKKLPSDKGLKVPNIGWNSVEIHKNSPVFKDIDDGEFFYFVHSYYVHAEDRSIASATIEYGVIADAAVEKGNIFATQFHPEKSSDMGLRVLNNFLKLCIPNV